MASKRNFYTAISDYLFRFVAAVSVSETKRQSREKFKTRFSVEPVLPIITSPYDRNETHFIFNEQIQKLPLTRPVRSQMFFKQRSFFQRIMSWVTYTFGSIFNPFLEIVSTIQCALHKSFSCPCSRNVYIPSNTTVLIATALAILALLYGLIIFACHGYADRIIYRRWQPAVLKRTEHVVVSRSNSNSKKLSSFRRYFGVGEPDTRGGSLASRATEPERPGSNVMAWKAEKP